MTHHSQFIGYGVQLELKDGKLIQGKIGKATSKGLTLYDVKFGDGGTSQSFKVRASRLKDLKVLTVSTNDNSKNNKNNNGGTNSNINNNGSKKSSNNSNNTNNNGNGKANDIDWQDDDVKKIKEQDDFDFQQNLSMFNKKDVFAQLKQQDEIDPSKRLVSHNKKNNKNSSMDNRGSSSSSSSPDYGKINNNYDIDEMVIPDAKNDLWSKIDKDNDHQSNENAYVDHQTIEQKRETNDYEDFESDSDNEKNNESDESSYLPITESINITHLLHSAVNHNNQKDKEGQRIHNDHIDNHDGSTDHDEQSQILSKIEKMISNQNSTSQLKNTRSNSSSISFNPTLTNPKTQKPIPMATAIQLLEIERLIQENFKISPNLLNNNFALNASYYIKQKLGGSSRLTMNNSNPEPLVLILASDSNRSGNKALTLGKYLCLSQQVRVITYFTCSLDFINKAHNNSSSDEENDVGNGDNNNKNSNSGSNGDYKILKENIEMFKKCGGKIVNSLTSLKTILNNLNSPIELIIDGIQGFDNNLIDFDPKNQNRIIEIIRWCNNIVKDKNIKICSIDLPSGYDSGSGLQNFDIAMNKIDYVLCSYSWPLVSLQSLRPVINYNNHNNENNVILVDSGIPKNVYLQRGSLRKFYNVDTFTTSGHMSLSL